MRLRDLQIGTCLLGNQLAAEVNKDSWCVSCHYLSKLPRFDAGNIAKVFVELVSKDVPYYKQVGPALGVYWIQREFDFGAYIQQNNRSRKEVLLEALHAGILEVANELHWEISPFEDAYRAIIADGFLYHGYWKSPKWNRSRSVRGQVYFCFDIDCLSLYGVALDKCGVEIKREILTEFPRAIDSDFYDALHKYGWVNDSTFYLQGKPFWHRWEVRLL